MIETDYSSRVKTDAIHILLVEDEYILAANLQENLESLGYTVLDIAGSATEAIEKAVRLSPDLVLMDIRLQGEMDGIQAAAQIWNRLHIPVIYVTGHSDKNTLERAKVTFPFGYLLKPVKEKELYVTIETALSRYQQEHSSTNILRSINDGVIVTNLQGCVVLLNDAAESLTGWQQDEAKDRDFKEVFNAIYEDTHLPVGNLATIAIQQGTTLHLRERVVLKTKDGTTFSITSSITPIRNDKGFITGVVVTFRDDIHRRFQEERNLARQRIQMIEKQKEELQRLDRLKDDFLSTISHELRTPLSNIKMAIQMLEISLGQHIGLDTPENSVSNSMTRYIDILRDQCNQELDLVNDLLELQQLEANPPLLEWISIDLKEWILQGVSIFQERAQCREQQMQAIVSPNLPVLISDLNILTRIFTELLVNACKYTPPDERIMVSARAQSAHRLQIAVCNTGVEVPADELTHIFDKFYRIPTSDRWQQGGTGLGLALVKKQVACLGGSVWAESSAGQTCLIVELPVIPLNYHA